MKTFLDTNIIVYAFADDPRLRVAETVIANGVDVSVQGLNEFVNVARRKLGFDWDQVGEALDVIHTLADAIHPLTIETHDQALSLAQRYGFSIYDALIVAAASQADCGVLYSEDMQDGLIVAGKLRIVNPFRNVQD